jgi:hypothetical protein
MLETRLRQAREQTLAGGQTDSSLAQLLAPQPLPAQLAAAIAACPWRLGHYPRAGRFPVGVWLNIASVRRVLEFGAGFVFRGAIHCALAHYGGGELTSIEQNPAWCQAQWQVVTAQAGVDAQMLVAQPQLTLGAVGSAFRLHAHCRWRWRNAPPSIWCWLMPPSISLVAMEPCR